MLPSMQESLNDITDYSPRLTISGLLKFLEKKHINITRPMIQNYIKIGLLRQPVEKRFYTHKHITTIALIERLKPVCSIETLKAVLENYMDDEGVPVDTYFMLIDSLEDLLNETKKYIKDHADFLSIGLAAGLVKWREYEQITHSLDK